MSNHIIKFDVAAISEHIDDIFSEIDEGRTVFITEGGRLVAQMKLTDASALIGDELLE